MKVRPLGMELFHADRRMGRHDEGKVSFRNIAKASKNSLFDSSTYGAQKTAYRNLCSGLEVRMIFHMPIPLGRLVSVTVTIHQYRLLSISIDLVIIMTIIIKHQQ